MVNELMKGDKGTMSKKSEEMCMWAGFILMATGLIVSCPVWNKEIMMLIGWGILTEGYLLYLAGVIKSWVK